MTNKVKSNKKTPSVIEKPKVEPIDIPAELKELKTLSRQLFEAKVNELFFMTKEELLEKVKDKKASIIDLWLTKLIVEGTKTGDLKGLQFLLDRIIGPVSNQTTIIQGHMSWVQYIEEHGRDDFTE
jgi:hypothetical protein